jgi:hypothetical protein
MLKRVNLNTSIYNKPTASFLRLPKIYTKDKNELIKKTKEEKYNDKKDNDITIVLSFIGKLPSYTKECLHQIRLFFNGDIYLIINDYKSIDKYQQYNVKIIDYEQVKDQIFLNISNRFKSKFTVVHGLKGREQLFLRSLERFFLLHNLMKKERLTNCLFMEIDNLIYDDPNKWLINFSKSDIAYMFDNNERCSSGIMYVKTYNSLVDFLNLILSYISTNSGFLNEMTCLFNYFNKNKEKVQILPTYYNNNNYNSIMSDQYYNYNSIFDAAAIGCYLTGIDPFHTGGKIILNQKWKYSMFDCTQEKFMWIKDEKNRKRPHIFNDENKEWILINNLHVHSKNLIVGIS